MAFLQMICGPLRCGCRSAAPAVLLLLMMGLWATAADSHVLSGSHILDMMVRKLAGPKTLQVEQSVMVVDPAVSDEPIELEETLRFIFPDRFRSDIQHEESHRIHVLSQGQALTVVDGVIASDHQGRFDRYKDLFLYNSRHLLYKALSIQGVDVGISSLGRMEDHIVFVIGADYPDDSVSQVWVDKERFVPLRWISVSPSETTEMEPQRLEFVYRNWQNVDGVWYPLQIDTFHNHRLIRQIRVTMVQADAAISGELLNVSHLMTLYKQKEETLPDSQTPDSDVDEVQRTIEDFRKKFE